MIIFMSGLAPYKVGPTGREVEARPVILSENQWMVVRWKMLPPEGLAAPPASAIVAFPHSNEGLSDMSERAAPSTLSETAMLSLTAQAASFRGIFAIANRLKMRGLFDDDDISFVIGRMREAFPLPSDGNEKISQDLSEELMRMHEALIDL